MTKKATLVKEIKGLLSDLKDLTVEVRGLSEDYLSVDLASDLWPTENIPKRVEFCCDRFQNADWYKTKIVVICPVNRVDYLKMKKKEMGKL